MPEPTAEMELFAQRFAAIVADAARVEKKELKR